MGELLIRRSWASWARKIAAFLQALGADDREGDVMPDASGHFGRSEVLAGGLEEFHRGLIFERRRVGHVDDDLGAAQRLDQAFAGDRVDSGVRRCRDYFVALGLELFDNFRTDQAGSADDYDLHETHLLLVDRLFGGAE